MPCRVRNHAPLRELNIQKIIDIIKGALKTAPYKILCPH